MRKKNRNSGQPFQELVAEIARAFDPQATVQCGEWVIHSEDGRRDMDVSIRGTLNGRPFLALVECKDYSTRTGPVGIGIVEELDSKRGDVGADYAFICSNSGFTRPAISKAKRVGIGTIAVLQKGDSRTRALIREEACSQRVKFGIPIFRFDFVPDRGQPSCATDLLHRGKRVSDWLQIQAAIAILRHLTFTGTFEVRFTAFNPVPCEIDGAPVLLKAARMWIEAQIAWVSQMVDFDCSVGIYDYIRGRLRIPAGAQVHSTIHWDTAQPVPPPSVHPMANPDIPEPRNLIGFERGSFMMQFSKMSFEAGAQLDPPNMDGLGALEYPLPPWR